MSNYIMYDKLDVRITNNWLPRKVKNMFAMVYNKKHDDINQSTTYEDNELSMLEFAKNVICHCNDDFSRDERLKLWEVEEAKKSYCQTFMYTNETY